MSEVSSSDLSAMVRAAVAQAVADELSKQPPMAVNVTPVAEPESTLDVLKRCVAQLHHLLARDVSVVTGSGQIHAAMVEALDAVLQVVSDNASSDVKGTE